MKKNLIITLGLMITILLAAGCKTANQAETTDATNGVDAATPLSSRLAIGILQLEDTDLAVTAEQAKTMLPLWKAVKSMSTSDTATSAELDALYDQIAEALTTEQTAAIEAMEMTPDQMTSLMTKLGIEVPQFTGGGMQNMTEEQRATQIAQFEAQGGVLPEGGERPSFQFSGGEPPSGGGSGGPSFSGPGGGGPPAGMMIIQGSSIEPGMGDMQGTQIPGSGMNRRAFGMNQMFIEPLIKLLEERTAS